MTTTNALADEDSTKNRERHRGINTQGKQSGKQGMAWNNQGDRNIQRQLAQGGRSRPNKNHKCKESQMVQEKRKQNMSQRVTKTHVARETHEIISGGLPWGQPSWQRVQTAEGQAETMKEELIWRQFG